MTKTQYHNNCQSIVNMSASEAREFLLRPTSYTYLDLPPCYDLAAPLKAVQKQLRGRTLNTMPGRAACNVEFTDMNCVVQHTDDFIGKLRQHTLIHPALYVSLVNLITSKRNWQRILTSMNRRVHRYPVFPSYMPSVHTSEGRPTCTQYSQWDKEVHNATVDLAWSYNFMMTAEVCDLNESILSGWYFRDCVGRGCMFTDKRCAGELGNAIADHLELILGPNRVGIPYGSALTSLLVELVFTEIDYRVTGELEVLLGKNCHVLRFQDQYRVFYDDAEEGPQIAARIESSLAEFNLKFKTLSTSERGEVFDASLDAAKAFSMLHPTMTSLEAELYRIREMSKLSPNSASVGRALDRCLKAHVDRPYDGNPHVAISMLGDVLSRSPRFIRVASHLIYYIDHQYDLNTEHFEALYRIRENMKSSECAQMFEIVYQVAFEKSPTLEGYLSPFRPFLRSDSKCLWDTSWLDSAMKTALESVDFVKPGCLQGDFKPEGAIAVQGIGPEPGPVGNFMS